MKPYPGRWSLPVFESLETRTLLTAPPAPILVDLQAASDSGVSNTDNLTNIRTGTLDITAARSGDMILVYRSGTLLGGATYISGTTYRYTFITDNLQEGANIVTARAWDGLEMSVDSPALGITLDTTPPTATAHSPNPYASAPVSQLGLTFSEAVNSGSFSVSDAGITDANG